ncbi:unnamed protein product [Sphenostylis stenocarpa]|uniref:Uncharacterized protein n=1 Tax=Sphenostylis stenocarpa TaxID=92480 RepID=A0AA86SQX4_9FABA|nr:unnamed protein product [Sphenostylis stenocarpa]
MAEAPSSSSLLKSVKDHNLMISESELNTAQNLMQLSDEDESNDIRGSKRRRNKSDESVNDIIMAKIQEIFGNDIEVFPTKKQRRYRSLVSIYMVTRPVNAANDTREGSENYSSLGDHSPVKSNINGGCACQSGNVCRAGIYRGIKDELIGDFMDNNAPYAKIMVDVLASEKACHHG